MNRAEDKLFENHFHSILNSKVKIVKAAGNNFTFELKHDVQSEEIKNTNKALPKGKYRVTDDKGAIVEIKEVGGGCYSISRGLLDSLIQISKEGSVKIKAAGISAQEMVGKIRENLQSLFPGRGINVSFNSKKGRIDIDFYSGKRGSGDLRDSFNKVQIVISPFDEMGRPIGSAVKTQMVFSSFTKEFGAHNRNLKKMPNIQTSHEKTIKEINGWFSKNVEELKQGDIGLPKSKTSVKAAEVTAQSLGEMIRKELNPIFGDRNFHVRVDVKTDKHTHLGNEGDIMISYASLPKGTKEIVDNSLSTTMISVRPFNEDGTLKPHGKVKAEAFRGTFFDKNHNSRKDIKSMRAVKGDPTKVAQSIVKWFKKNKGILLEEREGMV